MAEIQDGVNALRDSLEEKFAGRNDPNYLSAQNSYFSAQARSLSPACIVSPTTSVEVAIIVKVLVEHKIKFCSSRRRTYVECWSGEY
ncbi:hypothetical protein OCU04_009924 [Sclerotinia nivalis]|uniref:Uncharacterized protein n=1 Tax=Sclerotinia nivalis TaxID=352851 RepID=A0A9X0DFQ5_9HELO|nr:hypothetical protein OCU04_009924 [Sclerotinia nivalis]